MGSLWTARGYLVDLDGTLVSGRARLPDAARIMELAAGRHVIVSNDAEHTPEQLSRQLRYRGLVVAPDRIVLAGTLALDTVAAEMPGAAVMLLGGPSLRLYAARRGLRLVETERPDIVLLARDRLFSFARLAAAANAVLAGAALIATNPDRTHPGLDGKVVPETGALLAAVLACTGPVPVRVIGKPEPALFRAGLARLGIAASDAIMIGDNPDTDGEGARRLGMRFVEITRGLLPADAVPPSAGRAPEAVLAALP